MMHSLDMDTSDHKPDQSISTPMEEDPNRVSVGCQTEPNLIDKLINTSIKKPSDDIDLYQEYVRDAKCTQFWPLDKNPIRSIVPSMLKVDLPEQHLKNESLMFDLVQAIRNNSKLVNLLAKYLHHIVPNVIISKRIDLIPLITCTIRVCDDLNEQERLLSLLFNLIKRPNEEQRRMILSGLTVVLQVSPQHQSSTLLLPNLWDHVDDKFPERRILLAESCATLAHYVRPVMRTNLILSILIQLLRDKNAAVRLAACKSFACLLTLIMDRNDEVFDACLSATEDIINDVLQQTPLRFCEHRFELEEMRFCCLETIYPLICMWAVKLNRFKLELAEVYLNKTEDYLKSQSQQDQSPSDNLIAHRAKMINYLIPYVFSDAVHGCVWLSKSRLSLPDLNNNGNNNFNSNNNINNLSTTIETSGRSGPKQSNQCPPQVSLESPSSTSIHRNSFRIFSGPTKFQNKLLDPTMIVDEPAIIAFHDQLSQEYNIESIEWIMNKFFPKLLDIMVLTITINKFHASTGLITAIASVRQICQLFGKHFARTKIRAYIKQHINSDSVEASAVPSLYLIYMASLTSFEPIEQNDFEEIVSGLRQNLSFSHLNRQDVEILALAIKILATNDTMIHSPSTRQKFLTYILDALVNYSNQIMRTSAFIGKQSTSFSAVSCDSASSSASLTTTTTSSSSSSSSQTVLAANAGNNFKAKSNIFGKNVFSRSSDIGAGGVMGRSTSQKRIERLRKQTQTKEFLLIIFRHILSCIVDQTIRPTEWAHILVTKFLPILIMLANDSTDVHVCTYARLMCAQLVETFDNFLSGSSLTLQAAESIRPALESLKSLTEQIHSSNLKRQIECLSRALDEKFSIDREGIPKMMRANTIN